VELQGRAEVVEESQGHGRVKGRAEQAVANDVGREDGVEARVEVLPRPSEDLAAGFALELPVAASDRVALGFFVGVLLWAGEGRGERGEEEEVGENLEEDHGHGGCYLGERHSCVNGCVEEPSRLMSEQTGGRSRLFERGRCFPHRVDFLACMLRGYQGQIHRFSLLSKLSHPGKYTKINHP